jgi:branched-chain amino acid transport system substrate-binding protein
MVAAAIILSSLMPRPAAAAAPQESSGVAGAKTPIKIGFIVPLTGTGQAYGHQMLDGANFYLDEVHHQMSGRPVELVVEDDQSSASRSASIFHKLVNNDKVNLVSGVYFTPAAYTLAPLANEAHVPLVIAQTGADDVTKRQRSPWVIRTSWANSQAGLPFGEWAYKNLHYKRIVTIAMEYRFGFESVGDFQQGFEDAGGQIVQKLWIPLDAKEFNSTVAAITKDADAVYLATLGPACKDIPRLYEAAGLKMPFLGVGSSFDEEELPQDCNAVIGAVSALPYCASLDTPANKRFVKAFLDKYKYVPTWQAMCAYGAMQGIRQAVESCKGDVENKDKFMSALRSIELADSPRGAMKLDTYGNPIENVYIRKVQSTNGKLHNVVIHTIPMVSQFGKYKPEEYMKLPPHSRSYPPCTHCIDQKS